MVVVSSGQEETDMGAYEAFQHDLHDQSQVSHYHGPEENNMVEQGQPLNSDGFEQNDPSQVSHYRISKSIMF